MRGGRSRTRSSSSFFLSFFLPRAKESAMLGWNEHSGRLVRRLGPAAAPCTCNYSSLRLHLSKHVVNGESRWREIGGVFFIEDDDEFYYFFRNIYCRGFVEIEDGAKSVDFFL